jgi:hypothetical protein
MKTIEMIVAFTLEIPDDIDEGDLYLDVGKLDTINVVQDTDGKRTNFAAGVVWYETELCVPV